MFGLQPLLRLPDPSPSPARHVAPIPARFAASIAFWGCSRTLLLRSWFDRLTTNGDVLALETAQAELVEGGTVLFLNSVAGCTRFHVDRWMRMVCPGEWRPQRGRAAPGETSGAALSGATPQPSGFARQTLSIQRRIVDRVVVYERPDGLGHPTAHPLMSGLLIRRPLDSDAVRIPVGQILPHSGAPQGLPFLHRVVATGDPARVHSLNAKGYHWPMYTGREKRMGAEERVLTGAHFMAGDHACAEGALAGGCGFPAGHPMTPSTQIAERLAARLPAVAAIRLGAGGSFGAFARTVGQEELDGSEGH
jgi:hypothetical protein